MSKGKSSPSVAGFVLLVYFIGLALGFWVGSRAEVEFDERVMWHIRACDSKHPGVLRFNVDEERFVQYTPDTDDFFTNFTLTRGNSLPLPDETVVSALTGTTIGWSASSLLRSQQVVRLINRLSGRSKTQRILGSLVGILTGYSVGHYVGLQRARSGDSEQMQALVIDQKAWRGIVPGFLGFRLRMVSESLDDLSGHVRDKFEDRIKQASEVLVAPAQTISFEKKAAVVCAIENDAAPHFGFWRSLWDEQVQEVRYIVALLLVALGLGLAIGLVLLFKQRKTAAKL